MLVCMNDLVMQNGLGSTAIQVFISEVMGVRIAVVWGKRTDLQHNITPMMELFFRVVGGVVIGGRGVDARTASSQGCNHL
jgi:hypothetical protein